MAGEDGAGVACIDDVELKKKDEEEIKKHPFFQYYGQLIHQQNMLQDHVRTSTYQKAILHNPSNFKDKVVLDVGTGSGILAIFAAQAGARKVYAVEASSMAECASKLIKANGLEHVIEVVKGKIENIQLEEKVDIVISEPMGFLLVHERMLESYVMGRIRFSKPDIKPKMFPSRGTMYFLPFSDWNLYNEQIMKANFWTTTDFYGVDLNSLQQEAFDQNFKQPVVGTFDPAILIADQNAPATHTIDFETTTIDDMQDISIDFEYVINTTTLLHGLAAWFDVDFIGNHCTVNLSTSPNEPSTHWYQCRLLLPKPIAVNETQVVKGNITLKSNEHYSYDIDLTVQLAGTNVVGRNRIHLQDQLYHYLQSPPLEPAAY
mmetsp:Transcript_11941/g.25672  ORF Transcript_11941/g.25672 Transcript_11941/m.25672 type:complete len:375 (-) Transcript_11941:101-1225(-)